MLTNRILLVFLLIPFALQGWALDFSTYDELSKDLIQLAKASDNEKSDLTSQLLKKLDTLNNHTEDQAIYQQLSKIIKTDEGAIKLVDLAQALEAAREKFQVGSIEGSLKTKFISFFEDLLSGKKSVQNVAIVGITRGGKSTFLATMLNPLDPKLHASLAKWSLFSHTVNPSHHFSVVDSEKDGLYVARYIDTPGLSEVKAVGSEMAARTNEEIIAAIVKSLKGLVIHKVIQIFPISSSGLNSEDPRAFKLLQKALADEKVWNGKIDLVFPRADEIQHMLGHLIEELKTILPRYYITSDAYGAFYMSGSLFGNAFENGWVNSVLAVAPTVLGFRNALLKDIFGVPFVEGLVASPSKKGDIKVSLRPEVREKIKEIMPAQDIEEAEFEL